jgi:hypothetical protein
MRSQETVSHLEQQIEGEWCAIRVASCLCFLTCYHWIWQCFKYSKLESKWAVCFSFRLCSDHMQQLSLHRPAVACHWWHTVRGVSGSGSFHIRLIFSRGTGWLNRFANGVAHEHTHTHICIYTYKPTYIHTHTLSLSLSTKALLTFRMLRCTRECHLIHSHNRSTAFPAPIFTDPTQIRSCIMCKCLCRISPIPDNK